MGKKIENNLAPICLFTYNRLDETRLTVEALQNNFLASQSELFVFSDGYKDADGAIKVGKVRDFLKTIEGFKSVTIFESSVNKGLANSIIEGVSQIVNQYGKVIVLEDDLITTPNFLDFMNQCLVQYNDNESIISISGHSLKFNLPKGYVGDVYLYGRAASWGWATWKSRWNVIDWEVKDWEGFSKDRNKINQFNRNGSDMFSMLKDYMDGKNNSWAIRFCYAQFKLNKLTVFPIVSKINNIGFGENATNCNVHDRFVVDLDKSYFNSFLFPDKLILNQDIVGEIVSYYSIKTRIKGKLITWYYKFLKAFN
ncbi:sugar transferase [Flavobacterium sp. Arc2]|uniref:sugar transferase n=1 Tax=Flavobacterium sp. Arc2 TaxID=3046685 RepID=UPI00352C8FF1